MYCLACGYKLSHLSSSLCPECGRAFELGDAATYATTRRALAMRRARRRAGVATLLLVGSVALYVCTYAALVVPRSPMVMSGIQPWRTSPTYRWGGVLADRVFRPAAAIDLRLFPRRWQQWTVPEELIDTEEYSRAAWQITSQDEQLRPAWDRLRESLRSAEWANVELQMIDERAHSDRARLAREQLAGEVRDALAAEAEFRRLADARRAR